MTDLPTAIRTVRWMVRDTFRQSVASKLFWVMLGVTLLCTVFCFGITVDVPGERPRHPHEIPSRIPAGQVAPGAAEGTPVSGGRMSLGFGLVEFGVPKFRADAVRFLQVWLAGVLADTVGVLLALVWTAGFLPTFLEPHAVTVLLAKPAPRWSLLVGKYLGVVLFVGLHAALFVGGTWVGIGASTGVWDPAYWLAVPLLVTNFAVFYAVSALLAVCTRSTVVAIFGTILFWVLCWAMNLTHHRLAGFDVPGVSAASATLVEAGYWVLPKPLDLSGLFFEVMGAGAYSMPVPELAAVREKGLFRPDLAVGSSLLAAAAVLGLAAYEFRKTDY
ncbi:MAG: transcriptional regulator [Isosphaera sp.]|nr:transcriptional regulator [Isosphaera sp.]